MKKLTIWVSAVSAVICLHACEGGNGECREGTKDCGNGVCAQCCGVEDCAPGEFCVAGRCELEPCLEGESCNRDTECCDVGLSCDVFTYTCKTACTSDGDCTGRTDVPFSDDLKCKDGVCDFDHCIQDGDCPGGKVCFEGNCVSIPDCLELKECVVAPETAVTQQGTMVKLTAAAYLNSGSLAPGFTFDWSSSNINVAKVEDTGIVSGGSIAGSSTITATVTRCPSTTCTAQVTNVSSVQAGHTRVLVVDEFAGTAIEGATVVVGSQPVAITDLAGTADFSVELSSNNPADITVTHAGYNYVTFEDVESNDVIIHLRRMPDPTNSGGIRAKLDFSRYRCAPGNICDLRIGFGLISTPGDFFDVDFGFSSKMVCPQIELGGSIESVTVPAGFAYCLNQTCFKEHSSTVGVPGRRVSFGFGGKADLIDPIEIVLPYLSGEEEIHPGKLLSQYWSLYNGFYSGVVPNVNVAPIEKITDVTDIDCDEDYGDVVPDYDNFKPVDLVLNVPSDRTMTFMAPKLPVGIYDMVFVIGGAIVRDSGLIILGIGVGVDSKGFDDPEDGVIDEPIVLKVSDVAGRIPEDNVQRVVIVGALSASAYLYIEDEPFAAQVILVDSFEGSYTLEEFLTPPVASYDPVTRHLEFSQVHDSADCFRAAFSDDKDASWHVFTDNVAPIDLQAAPSEGDRSSTASIISIDLVEGLSYQDLPSFNDTNLMDLALLVKAFSYTKVASP